MNLRPCIDIHNGSVKQIIGSSLTDEAFGRAAENFMSTKPAAEYAALYKERGLPGGHIILLNSAQKEPDLYEADRQQALGALRAYPGGMQVGGGITPENAEEYLEAGASHVIVTSYVFREGRLDRERLLKLVERVGKERLVLDLSCRRRRSQNAADMTNSNSNGGPESDMNNAGDPEYAKGNVGVPEYVVVTDRWQKETDFVICPETLDELAQYCDEFLIHAADVEGKRAGIETELVRLLGQWMQQREVKGRPFPVTYAGGVHKLEDLDILAEASSGQIDVTVGSALDIFGGDLPLEVICIACQKAAARNCYTVKRKRS